MTILSVLICSVALNYLNFTLQCPSQTTGLKDRGYRRYRILIIQSLLERESEKLRLRKGMERSRETGAERGVEREGGRERNCNCEVW